MSITEIVSLILAMVGVAISIYFGWDNRRLNQKIHSLEWDDVVLSSKQIAKTISRTFRPDVIYAPDARGGIIATLIRDSLSQNIPVITGITLWKDDFTSAPTLTGYACLETTKWYILIPEALSCYALKNLLLVDDLTMTGDGLSRIRHYISNACGISAENIRACALVTSETAVKAKKAPEFYWKVAEHHDFFFPWGKAR